ncbi:hypothetical protein CTEN210_07901 [Chaetoceros tenuissimus]|uniref:Uncharacterized protein n=1 Tax=Chaetoceros tenuissimus TaxID=426638 RepID=A0AAD3H5S0_9STRA|nr:hypothetical protein CTEN210_07901 [Chaetoceros tenuissimus]
MRSARVLTFSLIILSTIDATALDLSNIINTAIKSTISEAPSVIPTASPTSLPSYKPSNHPTSSPSYQPSNHPTSKPSAFPTLLPTNAPTFNPSASPSTKPSSLPSASPSSTPTSFPSQSPTSKPSSSPSSSPSITPSNVPSSSPTDFFFFDFPIKVQVSSKRKIMTEEESKRFLKAAITLLADCAPQLEIENTSVIAQNYTDELIPSLDVSIAFEGKSPYNLRDRVEKIVDQCLKTADGNVAISLLKSVKDSSGFPNKDFSRNDIIYVTAGTVAAILIVASALFVLRRRRDKEFIHNATNAIDRMDRYNHNHNISNYLPSRYEADCNASQAERSAVSVPSVLFEIDSKTFVNENSIKSGESSTLYTIRENQTRIADEVSRRDHDHPSLSSNTDDSASTELPLDIPISRSAIEEVNKFRKQTMSDQGNITKGASVDTEVVQKGCSRFNCYSANREWSVKPRIQQLNDELVSNEVSGEMAEKIHDPVPKINFYPSMARVMKHKMTEEERSKKEDSESCDNEHEGIMFQRLDEVEIHDDDDFDSDMKSDESSDESPATFKNVLSQWEKREVKNGSSWLDI